MPIEEVDDGDQAPTHMQEYYEALHQLQWGDSFLTVTDGLHMAMACRGSGRIMAQQWSPPRSRLQEVMVDIMNKMDDLERRWWGEYDVEEEGSEESAQAMWAGIAGPLSAGWPL